MFCLTILQVFQTSLWNPCWAWDAPPEGREEADDSLSLLPSVSVSTSTAECMEKGCGLDLPRTDNRDVSECKMWN